MKTPTVLALLLLGCQQPGQPNRDNTYPRTEVAPPPTSATPAPAPTPTSVHVALGMPSPITPIVDPDDAYLIVRPQYVISYNRHREGPNWAAWRITAADYGGVKRQGHFQPDTSLPTGWYQVTHADYNKSGYDRGHMVRSEDRTNSDANNTATFLTINILPQKHDLNGGPWRALEDACRVQAQHDGRWVYVVAGGLYGASPATIGHGVAVPEAFWKVAVVLPPNGTAGDVTPNTPVMVAVMPNKEGVNGQKWTTFRVTLGEAERQSGWKLLGDVAPSVRAALEGR